MKTEQNYRVSYELAEMLKQKGFDRQCNGAYNKATKIYQYITTCFQNREYSTWYISAPLYSQVIDWLLEVHGVDIDVEYMLGSFNYIVYVYDRINPSGTVDTRQSANEAAIKEALKLI